MSERIAALALLLAGGAYLALAIPLPRGLAARPGPGFFPLLVGVLLCLAAIGFVIETFRQSAATDAALDAGQRTRVIVTSVALGLFCVALPWVGFFVMTFVFVICVLRALGGSWTLVLLTAALGTAAVYWVFAVLLSVPLPKGALFD